MTRRERDQNLLDRVKARVPPPANALPRLHARRKAKIRQARLAAGVVGLTLTAAIVGTVVILASNRNKAAVRPANEAGTVPSVAEPGQFYYARIAQYTPKGQHGEVHAEPN